MGFLLTNIISTSTFQVNINNTINISINKTDIILIVNLIILLNKLFLYYKYEFIY